VFAHATPQITEQQMTADEQLVGALHERSHEQPAFYGAYVAPLFPSTTTKCAPSKVTRMY